MNLPQLIHLFQVLHVGHTVRAIARFRRWSFPLENNWYIFKTIRSVLGVLVEERNGTRISSKSVRRHRLRRHDCGMYCKGSGVNSMVILISRTPNMFVEDSGNTPPIIYSSLTFANLGYSFWCDLIAMFFSTRPDLSCAQSAVLKASYFTAWADKVFENRCRTKQRTRFEHGRGRVYVLAYHASLKRSRAVLISRVGGLIIRISDALPAFATHVLRKRTAAHTLDKKVGGGKRSHIPYHWVLVPRGMRVSRHCQAKILTRSVKPVNVTQTRLARLASR